MWFCCALLAVSVGAQRRGDGSLVEGDLGRRLDGVVQAVAPGFWGCVVVARGGEPVLAKGYGMADFARLPNGPRILYDLGSLSTHFTQAAALRLCQEQKLDLDDGIGRHLKHVPADRAAITVRHLLEHTSGLPPEVSWDGGAGNAARTAIARILQARPVAAPGEGVHYSSLNTILLAAVVEEAGRAKFDDVLGQRLFDPAGLRDTGFLGDRGLDGKRQSVRVKEAGGSAGKPVLDMAWNWAHRGVRGVVSTGLDVQQWFHLLLTGKVLEPGMVDQLLRPLPGGDAYRVTVAPVGPSELVQLAGVTEGYRARVLLHRQTATCIVVLTAQHFDAGPLEVALAGMLARQLVEQAGAAPAPEPVPEPAAPAAPAAADAGADVGRFVGSFALPTSGRLVVLAEGGRLRVAAVGIQAQSRIQHGRWPPADAKAEALLRRTEEAGLALLAALRDGDGRRIAAGFAGDDAAVRARNLWRELQRQQVAVEPAVVAGTEAGERAVTWFRLGQGDNAVWLRGVWQDARRLAGLEQVAGPGPFVLELRVLGPDLAVGTTAAGRRIVVTVEGEGADRRLVWEDDSAGSAGLVECPLRS